MIKSIKLLRNSTTFKLAVAAGVSFILYELATFLFPYSFSDRSGVCPVPGVEYVFQDHRGTGYYPFVACGGDHPGLYGFWHVYVFAVTFILLPLFGQINDLVAKLPDYTTKVESTNMDWLLKDPSQYPRLPYNFETLIDDAMTWVMGFMGGILRNLFKSTMDIIANLVGLIVVPFLAFTF